MASVHFPINSLHSLIEHHIAIYKRFDSSNDGEFALVYFEYTGGTPKTITQIFKKVLRNSDGIFSLGDGFILLLPFTDWNGAVKVLLGLKTYLERVEEDTIVTFPDDSKDPDELLSMLNQRVEKYYDKTLSFAME